MEDVLKHTTHFADIKTLISLVAFLCTAAFTFVLKYRQNKLQHDRELIGSAPDYKRTELIEQVLSTWGLSARDLSNEQKFALITQKEKQTERRFYFTLTLSALLICLAGYLVFITYDNPPPASKKKIVLMDSPLRDVVYNFEGWQKGRTNADEITAILQEVEHFDIIKENTSLEWNREDAVLQQKPNLVIVHASCFYDQTHIEDADRKFYTFLSYVAGLDTKFLVYSRGFHHSNIWLSNLVKDIPALANKVDTLTVIPGTDFNDHDNRRNLKRKVKKLLAI